MRRAFLTALGAVLMGALAFLMALFICWSHPSEWGVPGRAFAALVFGVAVAFGASVGDAWADTLEKSKR